MEPAIQHNLGPTSPIISTLLEANTDDIRRYVLHRIDMDDNNDSMNDTLKHEIVERIVETSDHM
jgi:hypothetical protein